MSLRIAFTLNLGERLFSHRMPVVTAMQRRGADVHLIAPDTPGLAKRCHAAGISIHPWLIGRHGANILDETLAIANLARIYGKLRPNLVHNLTAKPVIYGAIAAAIAGHTAVVSALTGLGHAFTSAGTATERAFLAAYRVTQSSKRLRLIVQNMDDLRLMERHGIARGRTRLIRGSGVNPDDFPPMPPIDQPIILLPARLVYEKGVREAITAVGMLTREGVACTLRIAGGEEPGNPTAIPLDEIRAQLQPGRIEWLGEVQDMRTAYAACQIVCLPSYREGVPKALIEAASCERAIVTCDTPGCNEIVAHGSNGLLVPARNPAALADALRRMLADDAMRRTMALEGRRRVIARFSTAEVVQKTLAVYDELLGQV